MRVKMLHWVAWAEIIAGVFMLIDLAGRLFSHNFDSLVSLNRAVFLPIQLPTTPEMVLFHDLSIGVDFKVSLNAVTHPQFFAINLVALACLMALIFERP